MKYRQEIDGLRALAVVPVIFFHAGFDVFRGGFVGVDVFFVISGYLITTIIIQDIESNTFSLLKFYERRARRILPALFIVMLFCSACAIIFMSPYDFEQFSESLIYVSLFTSNLFFWQKSGYFDVASEQNPLLHTWSLSVEEQFYLIFPIFLLLAWSLGKNKIFFMIVFTAVLSFFLSELILRIDPMANFYLSPTRAWELLAGSVSSLVVSKKGVQNKGGMALVGLAAILLSCVLYDEGTPFPSFYALLPVIGTVTIILYSGPKTLVKKILSNKILVSLGLLSYSAYLWHQPIFAFARMQNTFEKNSGLIFFLIAVTFVFSLITWKFVEVPFRKPGVIQTKHVFMAALSGTTLFLILGITLHLNSGSIFGTKMDIKNLRYSSLGEKIEDIGSVCNLRENHNYAYINECYFGDITAEETIILFGDSHASAISYSLSEIFLKNKKRGLFIEIDGCQTIPYLMRDKRINQKCLNQFSSFLDYIKSLDAKIILSNRWTFKFFPLEGYIEKMPYEDSEGNVERDAKYREYDVLIDGKLRRDFSSKEGILREFLKSIHSNVSHLYLVYPIPETGIDIYRENFRYYEKNGHLIDQISISLADYDARNKFVIGVFDSFIEGAEHITKIDPRAAFCDQKTKRCLVQENRIPYYFDDDHLSKLGADLLLGKVFSN